METKTFISREETRGDCYRLLAACFYPPSKEALLQERLLDNLTLSLRIVRPNAAAYSEDMRKALSLSTQEALAVEHSRLFVGPFEVLAPPTVRCSSNRAGGSWESLR